MGMTKHTPPSVRPEANLAIHSQMAELVQTMTIQLAVIGTESARRARLRPILFIIIPKGRQPKAAPSESKDATHELSCSLILKGLLSCCSNGIAGDVHVKSVPAENTRKFAGTCAWRFECQSQIRFRMLSINEVTMGKYSARIKYFSIAYFGHFY